MNKNNLNIENIDSRDQHWTRLEELQERLGHHFKDMHLLELALTHSSWANDLKKPECNNERLEFLGDAVLELCISSELFHKYPQAREGDLTRIRASLVNSHTLAGIARDMGLPDIMKLGRGEERQGGRQRSSVLSDAMEAVIAAVYLDGGFMTARQTVNKLYNGLWPESWQQEKARDSKTRLQEISQSLFKELPTYVLEASYGPRHAPLFDVSLRLPDGRLFRATESSCKKAEQKAAAIALEELKGEVRG